MSDADKSVNRADITEPAVLIRVPHAFRPGMSDLELYEATRGVWKIGSRREQVRYAFAVVDGEVREAYQIDRWQPAHKSVYITRTLDPGGAQGRWECAGRPAPDAIRNRYVGRSVAHYFKKSAQNPIMYVNLDERL